jgi:hypothetical protein
MSLIEEGLNQVKLEEALAQINQMTELFRQHVRERDMNSEDLQKLIDAEQFAGKGQKMVVTIATLYEGRAVKVDGEPVMEPNDVTEMLDRAIQAGFWIRVQDPDSDVDVNDNFDYTLWTDSAETAWQQIVRMYMSVDEDFLVQFKKEGEEVREGHTHWIQIVPVGGNTPNDGWLCDGCACDSMDGIL